MKLLSYKETIKRFAAKKGEGIISEVCQGINIIFYIFYFHVHQLFNIGDVLKFHFCSKQIFIFISNFIFTNFILFLKGSPTLYKLKAQEDLSLSLGSGDTLIFIIKYVNLTSGSSMESM